MASLNLSKNKTSQKTIILQTGHLYSFHCIQHLLGSTNVDQ